ncbi:MAG: guanylate kinase [Dehalococcoidales bacterium]|nr:guanylate kinase [Dehalococcoidales bacterium]
MKPSRSTPLDRPAPPPLFIVLSGLSGAGKDAVLSCLKKERYPARFIVTATTRPRRPAEKDGVDYSFVTTEKFQKMIAHNELLEWANVYGNFYGVPRAPVKEALNNGQDAIVKVDVQGAATIKKIAPEAVLIFLTPPSIDGIVRRLNSRSTESAAEMGLRIKTAEAELSQLHLFDYKVINGDGALEKAVSDMKAIIMAEKCRVKPREIKL